jgi:integrase
MARKWTDEWIKALPYEPGKERVYPDPELSRHRLVVKRHRKVFEIQAERPKKYGPRKTFVVQVGQAPMMTIAAARERATALLHEIALGTYSSAKAAVPGEATLASAWARMRADMERRPASPKTIKGYDGSFKHLASLHDVTLRTLSDNPALMADEHARIAREHGPISANAAARLVRTAYNHARKTVRGLPYDLPTSSVSWNPEPPRTNALSSDDLPGWFAQWRAIENPVQRELALFLLLSGLRREDASSARWDELHLKRRVLHRPRPKGREGKKPAFDLPLSRAMLRCLWRARAAGRIMYPGSPWIFPADSASGHVAEIKKIKLSHHGHALRRSFAGLAMEAGTPQEVISRLLNHTLTGVTQRYQVNDAMARFLRECQERISTHIIRSGLPGREQTLAA